MNPRSITVQKAPARTEQLVLMFHGVGADPDGLVPLGRRMGAAFPNATIVSIASPRPTGNGGYEWFSTVGITEANRVARVAEAMPGFLAEIAGWQHALDVTPHVTALLGFSQGGIMALEASVFADSPAARVVAIASRFARLPDRAPACATLHLLHGKQDPVIPYRHTIEAAHHLRDLGGDVTADVIPFVGHEINEELAALAIERLRGYIPKRVWEEALRADPAAKRVQ